MKLFTELICPVSPEKVDENRVRVTALGVIIMMGAFFVTGNALFPALLFVDFFIRAFTRLPFSPLSWIAHKFVLAMGTNAIMINKAPKGRSVVYFHYYQCYIIGLFTAGLYCWVHPCTFRISGMWTQLLYRLLGLHCPGISTSKKESVDFRYICIVLR